MPKKQNRGQLERFRDLEWMSWRGESHYKNSRWGRISEWILAKVGHKGFEQTNLSPSEALIFYLLPIFHYSLLSDNYFYISKSIYRDNQSHQNLKEVWLSFFGQHVLYPASVDPHHNNSLERLLLLLWINCIHGKSTGPSPCGIPNVERFLNKEFADCYTFAFSIFEDNTFLKG